MLLVTLATVSSYAWSQSTVATDSLETEGDTIKKAANPTASRDSLQTIRLKELEAKSDLKVPITYKADDYMLLDMETKTLYLHKNGSLTYDKMSLSADSVAVDWNNNTMYADGLVDSLGQVSGQPSFADNEQKYSAKRMAYNFKTSKGLVTMARTKQGEEYVLGEYVRKENDSTYYIKNGKFTSCDLEHPHYYIKSSRLKVIPGKRIITGPLMLVIEDLPLPLVVPFGFFPNQVGQKSGIVMPTYGESADRGFFLRNGGYYFAINDYVDLLVRGDIFSKGGYRLEVGTAYKKRYRFDGGLSFEYGLIRFGERDDPEQFRQETRNFWVKWKHDQTINPQATLKANVNAGSSGFYRNNSYNEQEYLTSTLKSTINFSQNFANSPWRLNINADFSQNTKNRQVALELPSLSLNRARFFPFKGRNATGSHWYHNIGVNYSMNLRNQIAVVDTLLPKIFQNPTGTITYDEVLNSDTTTVTKNAYDFFNAGIVHNVPVSTQINLLNYINIQPSLNYREFWYPKVKTYRYSPQLKGVDSRDIYQFSTARDFSASVSASTRLYGLFGGKGARGTMVRHTLQPNMAFTYKPDFSDPVWGYFEEVQVDTSGRTERMNRFASGLQGSPGAGEQQQVSFGLSNILEMKYRTSEDKLDSAAKDPYTRITLLDQFAINSSYNFAAERLKLAPFAFVARTNFLNNKFNFQVTGSLDPYAVGPTGRRIDTLRVVKNGSLARLDRLNFTFGTVLASKKGGGAQLSAKTATPEALNQLQVYRDLYVDFDVPWHLSLNTILTYSNNGILRDTTFTINTTGDFNLSPKWKVGFTTGYDVSNKDFSYTSFTLYRDLHCWEMSLNWIPFGDRKSYNFTINVKSATLKDLKLTKRRDWQDRF